MVSLSQGLLGDRGDLGNTGKTGNTKNGKYEKRVIRKTGNTKNAKYEKREIRKTEIRKTGNTKRCSVCASVRPSVTFVENPDLRPNSSFFVSCVFGDLFRN